MCWSILVIGDNAAGIFSSINCVPCDPQFLWYARLHESCPRTQAPKDFDPTLHSSVSVCGTGHLQATACCAELCIFSLSNKSELLLVQGDSFGTRPKKIRISRRLFIRFWTCIYDYIPCFMKNISILEEMLEMFATTVQAELNVTLRVCESGLQDVLTNRSNFTSNVVFLFLYGAWLVGISFSF